MNLIVFGFDLLVETCYLEVFYFEVAFDFGFRCQFVAL